MDCWKKWKCMVFDQMQEEVVKSNYSDSVGYKSSALIGCTSSNAPLACKIF